MRVFVLTTGRSGSTTFSKACSHITNFTSGHETRAKKWVDRFDYPDSHIEVDPRLAWWLGTLDRLYGEEPHYVWLRRNPTDVARSTAKRKFKSSAISHWPFVAYLNPWDITHSEAAPRMVQSIEDNIALFLKDKHYSEIWIDQPEQRDREFRLFWGCIGAEGDFEAALAEFGKRYNSK